MHLFYKGLENLLGVFVGNSLVIVQKLFRCMAVLPGQHGPAPGGHLVELSAAKAQRGAWELYKDCGHFLEVCFCFCTQLLVELTR